VSLAGRTILVTGGTSGVGLAVAIAAHRLGAQVVVGSRSHDSYAAAAEQVGDMDVSPFIADMASADSVDAALDKIPRPDDIVHAAAGGLESLLRPLLRAAARIRRVPEGPERETALAHERDGMARLVDESAPGVFKINQTGPRLLIERLAPRLPDGGRIIVYSSLWSEGVRSGSCPAFYSSVAESKRQFEDWLDETARGWGGRISAAVIVGHLISDTAMGKLIDRNLLPLMPQEVAGPFRAGYVTVDETANATIGLLTGKFEPNGLRRYYLVGSEKLTLEPDPEVMAVVGRMPL